MQKVALVINGVAAPMLDDNFLKSFLTNFGYEVVVINLVGESVKLNSESINDLVTKELNGREVEVILGWSLGALVAPMVAINYPESKLILVAGGVGNLSNLRFLKKVTNVLDLGLALPKDLLVQIYGKINSVDEHLKEKYNRQMGINIDFFRNLGSQRIDEIIDFLSTVHNGNLLKKINNKSMVVNGVNDKIFPIREGAKISRLLKNGRMMVTDGGHYNVLGEKELPVLREFLEL